MPRGTTQVVTRGASNHCMQRWQVASDDLRDALSVIFLLFAHSRVTYTEVSNPFEGLSDIGSPRADDHEYLELPGMPGDPYVEAALQVPPSTDYVHGPEEPEQAPPSPDYVPGPEHADDEIVAEDQPYAEDASPTVQSPDYVPESDPEADPTILSSYLYCFIELYLIEKKLGSCLRSFMDDSVGRILTRYRMYSSPLLRKPWNTSFFYLFS
ncbi:hypothetical protein Tco_0524977 [Tanacetum coccineum]